MPATEIKPPSLTDEAQEMLDSLCDVALTVMLKEAISDCTEAANTQRDSEWHQTCFAACVTLSDEITKRSIDMRVLH